MKKNLSSIINIIIVVAIIIVLNAISSIYYKQFDLTEDHRFTLSEPTVQLISNLQDDVFVKVYLEGDFPSGFKRLREEVANRLLEFNALSSRFQFEFEDPNKGSKGEMKNRMIQLQEEGIKPILLDYFDGDQKMQKRIFPFAVFHLNGRSIVVNLLEAQELGVPEEVILNNSVSLLEYKFGDAVQKLTQTERPNIVFLAGNRELAETQTISLVNDLKKYYNIAHVTLDSTYIIPQDVAILIIAKPMLPYQLRDQFIIDQYIMNGGKVIWLIDYLNINLDSIQRHGVYVPPVMDLGLDNMFFKYGIRFQPNLIMDLECTRIPQVVGMQGDKPKYEMMPWPYHPLIYPLTNHPIAKNLDRLNLLFPSSIDTIHTKLESKKTVLLKSSPYTRYQMTPMRIGFSIFYDNFDKTKYTKTPHNLAVLIEGKFESAFKNRVSQTMLNGLNQLGANYKEQSTETKQLFVSDGDLIKNLYNPRKDEYSPIAYNQWEKTAFKGNQYFIKNAIEYMIDPDGVLSARSKEVTLRLLNQQKARDEKTKWRLLNLGLPLVSLVLFGLFFNFVRRRKYT